MLPPPEKIDRQLKSGPSPPVCPLAITLSWRRRSEGEKHKREGQEDRRAGSLLMWGCREGQAVLTDTEDEGLTLGGWKCIKNEP